MTSYRWYGLFLLTLVLSGCRQDMHNQPKFIPLRSSEFFPDRRSARYPVPGTVAQLPDAAIDAEQLDPNSYFLTGRHNGTLGNDLPAQLTEVANGQTAEQKLRAVLERGRQRYNIYCTPCHAWRGDGYGMIVQRGYKQPPSFHTDRLRNAPLGHFFDVIGNGFGAMPDYGAQIAPEDRWAIAAYIRALQRSQNAAGADLTPQDREQMKAPTQEPRFPPTSKTDQQAPESPAGGVKR